MYSFHGDHQNIAQIELFNYLIGGDIFDQAGFGVWSLKL